ncbi:hypothetical protein DFH09DRAFT_1265937 [Mycena vulgaris]|nr:hypothetical protein DFH09DRAFT_1265937 [Mycena vulgaris]
MSYHNRNPQGKNQHTYDERKEIILEAALRAYHMEKIISNVKIAARFGLEYGIISESTVKRRRKDYGLTGGAATERTLTAAQIEQLVLNQLDEDTAKRWGVGTVWHKISFDTGTILTRVAEIMHILHAPDDFAGREPTAKKVFRVAKFPLGIHERWAGDDHDELYKIGFPIWMMVDDATAKILKAWVVPSNRIGDIIAYLFLCPAEECGGVPLQTTTDCGSETTLLYGIVKAMRVHNISVERTWLRLRLDFGDTAVLNSNQGVADGKYDSNDADQYELCQWLWPRLIQKELDNWARLRNGIPIRKQTGKAGTSGVKAMSRNDAFPMLDSWGGINCLQKVDVDVIRQMKMDMGGDELIAFTTSEFAARAQVVFDSLGPVILTPANVWDVFFCGYASFGFSRACVLM